MQAAAILDFGQPIAIMLVAILHYIPDESQARQIVAGLLESVPAAASWPSPMREATCFPRR